MTESSFCPATRGGDGLGALIGKKLFVAGGGSGMGAAIARLAAARGAHVALAGRSRAKLDGVAATLRDKAIATHAIDLSDQDAVTGAVAAEGPFDHIVTTAGDLTFKPLVDLSEDEINRMLASRFWGPVNIARAAATHLVATGSLIFVSGLAGYRPSAGSAVVGALNLALESLAMGLALELRPRRVNVISPGVIDTPLWSGMGKAERKAFHDRVAAELPAGRIGTVEDIAHAAISLMENGFMTGSVVHVDGGGRIA
ncbi:SDR family oxidoreductase [Rhizobiaceae bacterium BDR2-2]|uniref:SDR family oxidoreductase n=1 Tax=Ectorhizobium quercum TaxID=2965071 RepID=A0AAE3SX48_9HYPH|nr:SDR family oxidoreductase [Ectorhizobium quercum]MCX8999398.1 SDR family oxidoreductase [Ectorhizobium quercum]